MGVVKCISEKKMAYFTRKRKRRKKWHKRNYTELVDLDHITTSGRRRRRRWDFYHILGMQIVLELCHLHHVYKYDEETGHEEESD